MYRILNIGGKDYRLEYSFEASLYPECVESITSIMNSMSPYEDDETDRKEAIKGLFSGMANLPKTALTIFYAGLMEAHGSCGDGSVPDISAAKGLIKEFISEHKDDDTGNFFGIFNICLEQMSEDGFFKLIGLETIAKQTDAAGKKQEKVTQDHKKKETKTSGKQS